VRSRPARTEFFYGTSFLEGVFYKNNHPTRPGSWVVVPKRLSVPLAAKYLRVDPATVYRLVLSKQIRRTVKRRGELLLIPMREIRRVEKIRSEKEGSVT